jgi:hypothetical protein
MAIQAVGVPLGNVERQAQGMICVDTNCIRCGLNISTSRT